MSAERLLRYTFRGLLSVYSHYGLHARQVAFETLYTGGSSSFATFSAVPIPAGWSEPVPKRDLHPLLTNAFHGAQHSSNKGKVRFPAQSLSDRITLLAGDPLVPRGAPWLATFLITSFWELSKQFYSTTA